MSERKILFVIISVIFYCLYSVQMWFVTNNVNDETPLSSNTKHVRPEIKPNKPHANVAKSKMIPLFPKDACSVLQVFIQRPNKSHLDDFPQMDLENNALAVIGITVFLFILVLNALFDVIRVKEIERARREFNPEGEIRQSLAEFANKKMLRRASSKLGQLFQISESEETSNEETKSPRESRPYVRAESINSYLGESSRTKSYAREPINKTPVESEIFKRQSVSSLLGARPTPMLRRSSYPALPLNPEIQGLMMDSREPSFDSDDETEKKRRRVRILRRF